MTLLVAKILGLVGLLGFVAESVAPVVGTDPRQVLNTSLNVLAVAAAGVAAQWIRELRRRTDRGETPAAVGVDDLRELVLELREVALSIREGLGRAGVIENRLPPQAQRDPERRDG